MTTREMLSLAPGVGMVSTLDGQRALRGRVELTLPPVSPGVGAALDALAAGQHSVAELTGLASRDGVASAAVLQLLLEGLSARGALARTLQLDGAPLSTLAPAPCLGSGPAPREGARYSLSRFAFTRVVEGASVLETPLSMARVWMPSWHGPALLGALATPRSPGELAAAVPGIPAEASTAFLRLLLEAGALTEAGTEPEALATWEFHDLLFHGWSRWGRHPSGYGGATYRLRGRVPAPPEKKPLPSGEVLALEVPDLAAVEHGDPPFTAVLERRRSIAAHGTRPLNLAELSELLYRAVGLRRAILPGKGEQEARPYPSGGALYELEVYVVPERCEGLEPGLYHYRPEGHLLTRIAGRTPEVELLVKSAANGASLASPPQVLLVLAARFPRVAWKYEAMAYALMLKHVGVLFQTLYLVATAMGLAPCALGGGSAEVFARASGLDPLVEGSVGEFLLGTPPDAGG